MESRQEYAKGVFERGDDIATEYDASITPILAHGRTHRAIIDQYEGGDIDFVVLGLRGKFRGDSYLKGDVFERLLRTVDTLIPMVPVRESWTPTHTHLSPDDPRHIVVPFDGSPEAEYALEIACTTSPEEAIVTTYIDSYATPTASRDWIDNGSSTTDLFDEYQEQSEEVLARAEEIAGEYSVTIETATGYGPVKEGLIDYVSEHDSGLIVLGSKGRPQRRTFLSELLVGQLIQNAPVPVLSVSRPEKRILIRLLSSLA